MPDVLTLEQRRRNMSSVRSRDTKPELIVRRELHRGGFRYRLHVRGLPGTPDVVLPRHKSVVFVHGCYWHGHDCAAGRLPKTHTEFWNSKIEANRARDVVARTALRAMGWRIFTIWGCAIRGRAKQPEGALVRTFVNWLASLESMGELAAREHRGQP